MKESCPKFKKIILVGLGGAGKLILTHLKKQLIDMYNVVPPSIKFISLDTDLREISMPLAKGGPSIQLEDLEFLHLKVPEPIDFINNSSVKEWFIKPLPAGAVSRGAGAVREVGRMALFHHLTDFTARIDQLVTQLNSQRLFEQMANAKSEINANTNFKLAGQDVEISICGSLAGGTGSGTFLDVSILLRNAFPNALIHGFFLLNWIFRNKAFAYRVSGNVYAALSELDYLQNIKFGDRHYSPYKVKYSGKEITVKKPPFDMVHLIDGRNELGENVLEDSELCETVATAISLSSGAEMADAVASVVDNLKSHLSSASPKLWGGHYPKYSSFGLSSLHYPANEIHGWLAYNQAQKLCGMALTEVQSAATDQTQLAQIEQEITADVNQFFGDGRLNLINRSSVRDKACPFKSVVAFSIQPFQISEKGFPGQIVFQFKQEEENINKQLKKKADEDGRNFTDEIFAALALKVISIRENPANGNAYLKRWIESAAQLLTVQRESATKDMNAEDDNARNRLANAESLKELAVNSRYLPLVGGDRKKTVGSWAAAIVDYLTALKDRSRFDYEQRFYGAVMDKLTAELPASAERSPEVIKDLTDAKEKLHTRFSQENENLKALKKKTSNWLIGHGDIVVVAKGEKDVTILDGITLDFGQFKTDLLIHKAEDYKAVAAKKGKDIATLFADYCIDKLAHLKTISIQDALETIGKSRGDENAYIKEQFDHLFRLSSALWSFDEGKLNPERRSQVDRIINFGVREEGEGRKNFDNYVISVKGNHGVRAAHAYSSTGDPHRIWLLNFSAALPAYFINGLEQSREIYLNEISPTYHIDKYFEMNVPDLFPVSNIANKALRVIGMCIVPGIDVIEDHKLSKGHLFVFKDPTYIKNHNFGKPMQWSLFREMYDDIVSNYNEKGTDNLLDVVTALLKQKVSSMAVDELHATITKYINNVKLRLAERDFSRLVSARLTYREIQELDNFLKPDCYGMDIHSYIEGVFKR